MKNKLFITVVIVVIATAIVAFSAMVQVYEDESVCIKRFEQVITVYEDAGLKFKMPFVDTSISVVKNAMTYDLNPSDVLTVDKKSMTVSSYCVWRIDDPLKFLQTIGNYTEAERRLDASVYNSVKTLISSMSQMDVISSRGGQLDEQITTSVREQMLYYGLNVMDIQIKQFDLPSVNKDAVYSRMVSERQQMAAQYTAEGKEEAEKLRNTADKEKALLISEATAKAEQLKAEGESEYMRILTDAFKGQERAEFYKYIRSLDALNATMKGNKTIILPMDSELTKWFLRSE